MSVSFTGLGSAIGSFVSSAGAALTAAQQSGLVQAVLNVVNPNASKEKQLLGQMAAFIHTEPALIPDLVRQFSEISDSALAGAISPLLSTPLPEDALQTILAVESMLAQGM